VSEYKFGNNGCRRKVKKNSLLSITSQCNKDRDRDRERGRLSLVRVRENRIDWHETKKRSEKSGDELESKSLRLFKANGSWRYVLLFERN